VCSEQILSRTHRLEVGSPIVTQALVGVLNVLAEQEIITLLYNVNNVNNVKLLMN